MAAETAAEAGQNVQSELKEGSYVEVFGLESENGKQLNGQKGLLAEFLQDSGRWQVRLGPEKIVSVRPDNLRKAEFVIQPPEESQKRSRSSSSSSSSSSPSRERSAKGGSEPPLQTGEQVEIFGLTSEQGKALNGQKGVLTEFSAEKDRWEVMLSLEKVISLRAGSLRRAVSVPGLSGGSAPKKQKTSEGSLAALLGFGNKEESKEKLAAEVAAARKEEWKPLWARSCSVEAQAAVAANAMSEDQLQYLQSFNAEAEQVESKEEKRAAKVRKELVLQGIVDEDMIREVVRQREEERRQLILFRGPAAVRDSSSSPSGERGGRRGSKAGGKEGAKKSRSASGSSSSSSESGDDAAGAEGAKGAAAGEG